ncbi:MAG: GDSL-type esterase/lipase family protein [Patescibacteria group bacterium]|jgi:lysophospholipase L1-like esterase
MPVICIFGDSTAWGAWDKEDGGWVNRLWLEQAASGGKSCIYNLSISGGTTETILERFEREAKIREADILIFQTGGNDAAYDKDIKEHLVSPDKFEKNIQEIIDCAKKLVKNIVFVGFNNCDESKTTPVSWCNLCYTNDFTQKYNGIIKNLCDKNAVNFIDIFGLLQNTDLEDGLHPNAAGHKKIFAAVKDSLKK